MGNWIFQKQQRWIWLSVGAHFCFALVVYAMEISEIPQATASEPSCSNTSFYREICTPQPYCMASAPGSKANCDSCKTAIQNSVNTANGVLNSAKAQDQAINAANAASNAADAAGTQALQQDPQFKTGSVNQSGLNSLQQQQQLAQQVSTAMKNCAKEIKKACTGPLDGMDQQAADSSAQSCEQSGTAADGVAAEKAAKAAEMAKNGQQANQNGQGMQPPQMPQGGSGDPGLGSTNPYDSKISSSVEKAKTAKLDSGFSGGKSEIPVGQGIESGLSSERNTASTSNGSSSASQSGGDKSTPTDFGNSSGGAAGASRGVSGSGGFGGLGSSSGKSTEAKTDAAVDAKAAVGDETPLAGGGSSFKPTLGLKSSGDELAELINQPGATTGSSALTTGHEAAGQQLASHGGGSTPFGGDDISLFKRIKSKITSLSRTRNMQ